MTEVIALQGHRADGVLRVSDVPELLPVAAANVGVASANAKTMNTQRVSVAFPASCYA
jgi:hypothetical protein